MSLSREVKVAVIGTGGVGKYFLSQLEDLSRRLSKAPFQIKLSLILVSRSKKILYNQNYECLPVANILTTLENSAQKVLQISEVIDYLTAAPSRVIMVDNTSSQDIASMYPQILQKGISIVTPNKKAFSDSYKLWEAVFSATVSSGAYVYHESSVGAGLPIISTLNDLLETGDKVTRIEGVFSGTMSFLFNAFAPINGCGASWSEVVIKAKKFGFTEPDPRDDLNGMDVARKLTILARLVGLPIDSPTSFPVQSLVPKELESTSSGEEFLQKLPKFDSEMEKIKLAAEQEDKVVRFVGSICVMTNEIKVGLERFDRSHPIAMLKGSDNLISFHTERYGVNPLIIQGAGAGGDVTAMGVTADLIKVIRRLS